MIEILVESTRTELEALLRLAPRLALAVLVLVLAVLTGRVLAHLVARVLERGRLSPIQRGFFRRATVWLVAVVGLAVALNIVGLKTAASGLLAGGGITAIVLGFAFREIGENFLAGMLLAFSRPFKIGDVVQSGDFKGTVRGIELRHTHIRTSDGRDIFLPNSQIINSPLTNFTRDGLLRPAFTVGIDYADDPKKACELIVETARGVPGIAAEPSPSAVILGLEASWVLLEVAFWIDTFQKGVVLSRVRSQVMDGCRRRLLEEGFTVSSEVTTNVALSAREGIDLSIADKDGAV